MIWWSGPAWRTRPRRWQEKRPTTPGNLSPLIANLILGVVEEKAAGLEISRTDQQFLARFYQYAFVGVMLEWIGQHMKEDPADIVERTSRLMQGNVVRALQAFGTGEQPAKN